MMRRLAVVVVAVLLPLAAAGQKQSAAEFIWNSTEPENKSTFRWVCSGPPSFSKPSGADDIEFRFYPKHNGAWIIRHGQTFTFAIGVQLGLETHFTLDGSSHEIHIGADRVAKYYAFSGQEGEMLPPSALWYGCKESG
jgi:hypothetical protein